MKKCNVPFGTRLVAYLRVCVLVSDKPIIVYLFLNPKGGGITLF